MLNFRVRILEHTVYDVIVTAKTYDEASTKAEADFVAGGGQYIGATHHEVLNVKRAPEV